MRPVPGVLPKAILFDLDGTLIDSRKDLASAVNCTRRDFNLPAVAVDEVVSWVGDGVHRLLERAFLNHDLKQVYDRFLVHYGEHLCEQTTLYPGIASLLDRIWDRKTAIITNKAQVFTEPLLEILGLSDRFDVVIGARQGLPLKPDPAPILEALRQLQLDSTEAVMIGDSTQDIAAGKNAGVYTCAVSWGFRSRVQLEPSDPDWIVSHPGELEALL